MAATSTLVRYEDPLEIQERSAVTGVLAGYSGNTRVSYTTDLRLFADWCADNRLRLLEVRRAHLEIFGPARQPIPAGQAAGARSRVRRAGAQRPFPTPRTTASSRSTADQGRGDRRRASCSVMRPAVSEEDQIWATAASTLGASRSMRSRAPCCSCRLAIA
jgi:hypothetical protein